MDYSYIREALNKDLFNNFVLSIQLEPDGFSFYITHKESIYKPLYFSSRKFEKSGIGSLIQELKQFHEFDNDPFHKTLIIYHTSRFCMIPDELFNPEQLMDYFRLSHPISDDEIILTSDIQLINSKVLYGVHNGLITFLKTKFPEAFLIHSACPAINYGMKKSGKTCLITHYEKSISIAVFDMSALKLFNIYKVHDVHDLVYYIFNSLKSCNQEISETVFYFTGIAEKDSDKKNVLARYISKPVYYKPELMEVYEPGFPSTILFNHLEGLNCVL
jgi:hypothetical protein